MTLRTLGQVAVQTAFAPPAYGPYPGVMFQQYVGSNPNQPYQFKMSDADVDKAIYSSLPTQVKAQSEVTGTEPQKLVVLDSGLEVPAYILEREKARKELEKIEVQTPKVEHKPVFFDIGLFATESPLQATIIALGIGSLLAKIYVKFKSEK